MLKQDVQIGTILINFEQYIESAAQDSLINDVLEVIGVTTSCKIEADDTRYKAVKRFGGIIICTTRIDLLLEYLKRWYPKISSNFFLIKRKP